MSESEAVEPAQSQDASSENDTSEDLRSKIENLEQTNQLFLNKFDELKAALSPSEKKKEMTSEEYGELLKTDPQKAIEYVVSRQVSQGLHQAEGRLTQVRSKDFYDNKAEKEFPLLSKDMEFQKAVKNQMNEMIKSGEMTIDAPTLVYRSAQIAALKYKPKAKEGMAENTSESSGGAEAPRSRGAQKTSAGDQHFDQMVKLFGIKNVDRAKEKFAAHRRGKT